MMLDIVITHYNEPWEVVRSLMYMLGLQKGVDFSQIRVQLIHDGGEAFPEEYFDWMPFKVHQSVIKHGGVSVARNYGLDHASAKWVCFCDCDDTFLDVYSLKYVFDCLGTNDYDLLWAPFIQENKSKQIQLNECFNTVWIHNKYYRLDFLREHNFRFGESLVYGEDSAFNSEIILEISPDRIGKIKSPAPLYMWTYREGSATTSESNKLKNMIGQFDRNLYMVNELRKRNDPELVTLICRTITDSYATLTRIDRPDGCEQLERRVINFYRKNKSLFKSVDDDRLKEIQKASDGEAYALNFFNEDRPKLSDWLKQLEAKYV